MYHDELKIIGNCPVTGLTLKTKDSWKYKDKEYFIHPYAIGDGSIIIINSKGKPNVKTIKFGINVFTEIQKSFKNIEQFVLISDQKDVKPLPTGARRYYIDYVKDNPKIIGAIFYNVNSVTRLSLKLGKSLNITKVNVLAANSYSESISIAYNMIGKDAFINNYIPVKKHYINIYKNIKREMITKIKFALNLNNIYLKEELEFLNEFLLNIDWKSEEDEFDITKFNDSIFKFIYETIIYIKSDLHNLIKERDEHREKLEELNQNLEKKVEERTKELKKINENLLEEISKRKIIEKNLTRAKELAEEANNAKSLFLANVSHELKTPMNSILGYSSIGIQKIDKINKDKIKNYFERINKGGKRLLLLLDDLIDVARFEQPNTEYELIKMDISQILKLAIEEISYKAQEKNIKILFNYDKKNKYTIEADKKRIRQVIDNILTNAIKFTAKNKEIEIDLKDNTKEIIIEFKDHGPGIESSEIFKIFDSFYQGIRTKTNATNGTGLGLAISKKIIIAHNGKIWARNRDDSIDGSIFIIEIPKYQ